MELAETGSVDGAGPVRVFISYAHDDEGHIERVREFWLFLRSAGVDARLDLPAAEQPQDWPVWMQQQIEQAMFVLVIASPAYRMRAEGSSRPDEGRGVAWEAGLLRELAYADRGAALARVLPGCGRAARRTASRPGWGLRAPPGMRCLRSRWRAPSACCGI